MTIQDRKQNIEALYVLLLVGILGASLANIYGVSFVDIIDVVRAWVNPFDVWEGWFPTS